MLSDREPRLTGIVFADVLLGGLLCFLGAWAVFAGSAGVRAWNGEPSVDAMGAYLLVYFGCTFVLAGTLFLVAAAAFDRRWRGRWWIQALPFSVVAVAVLAVVVA